MRKINLLLIVILLLAALFTGCNAPSATEPQVTVTSEAPTAEQTTIPNETESDEDIVYEGDASSYYIDVAYAEQIGRYHTALSEKWDEDKYFENNMSALPAYYYEGNPLENVGFGFVDLDNDGRWELIIGAILLRKEVPETVMFCNMWKRTGRGMLPTKLPMAQPTV